MTGKQKEKSVATRKRIMECAEELFCRKGFDKTPVWEIVKAAGVAQGTFYLYFETKEEILKKIAEKAFVDFNYYLEMLDTENPTLDDIDKLIDTMVLYMKMNPNTMKLFHDANIIRMLEFKEAFEHVYFSMKSIEKWLRSASEKGIIKEKPPKLYAGILFQLTHEILEKSILYEFPDNIDVVKDEVKQIIKDILT
ncbi:TetR/AcrR family transcriptional regulator [Candidatus Contubernalis alkaliaceticus]|uniref:TetR/AcrR family transcriptional regulator n=1 Tax=Candidatus Contubernalis alkaliaceticus TaxID=338645 RepID=UPI001F4BEE41|nr:TetR/AcrR family transcriptional regulator [Candidatus Contubernalis alkalaceticus]UNC93235.1 TetR/AcrR family transcriptional regulator [Candidatus Contubernalis alkalaceticus]